MSILTFHCEPARSRYTRYRLDPVFDRMPDGAVIGIIRYDIYLDGRFVGSRRTHAQCHNLLDELMPPAAEPECDGAGFCKPGSPFSPAGPYGPAIPVNQCRWSGDTGVNQCQRRELL